MIDAVVPQRFSLNVGIEKLDGGYISDITGKRRIFKNALDIDDAIDIKSVLSKVEENEYILSIDLIPKNEIKPDLNVTEEFAELSILEKAKLDGVIQPAEKFNPLPKPVEPDIHAPIAVNTVNSYSIAELNAIDWKKYDELVPLTLSEKVDISGIVSSTMYNVWRKVMTGTFQWQSINTRVGMTILAKYYERIIEKKSKIESLPPRNDKRLLDIITEIELLAKSSHVKSNVLLKKTEQLKKLLIQN